MNNEVTSRWMALLEGVDCVDSYCDEKQLDIDKYDLKISALKKFVRAKAPAIENLLNKEDAKRGIKHKLYTYDKPITKDLVLIDLINQLANEAYDA